MNCTDIEKIRVYSSAAGLSEDAIFELLRNEAMDNLDDMFSITLQPAASPQQICQHHHKNYFRPEYSETQFLIIFDSAKAATDGVLLVNLEAEHGCRDAIREMPSMAALASGSISVAQSDWFIYTGRCLHYVS